MISSNVLRKIGVILAAVLLAAVCWVFILKKQDKSQLFQTFSNPENTFLIEVYAHRESSLFPGQSGDRSGYLLLKDRNGAVLEKTTVEMVSQVEAPVWEAGKVSHRLLFEWDLPETHPSK